MRLELKHLAPYLPYKLVGTWMLSDVLNTSQYRRDEERRTKLTEDNVKFFLNTCKPILRPMSDLEGSHKHLLEEMHELGQTIEYHSGSFYDGYASFDEAEWLPFYCFEILLREHFDVFGLLDSDLMCKPVAIDINTLSNG